MSEPQHFDIVVIGGGYIGAEIGYFFAALGIAVTVINPSDQLLAEDDDVREMFTREFGKRTRLVIGRAIRASRTDAGKRVEVEDSDDDTQTVEAEHILIATGRRPNTDRPNLEATGVGIDERGAIRVAAILIHEVVVAMTATRRSADLVRQSIHIHPSLSELVGTLFANA